MKFSKVKKEIKRISEIQEPRKTQKEIRSLHRKLNLNRLELRKRGNQVYFYEMEDYYDTVKRRSAVNSKSLGVGISQKQYREHKQTIKKLLNLRKKQELIQFLANL